MEGCASNPGGRQLALPRMWRHLPTATCEPKVDDGCRRQCLYSGFRSKKVFFRFVELPVFTILVMIDPNFVYTRDKSMFLKHVSKEVYECEHF